MISISLQVEDLAEEFLERTSSLLNERNHGMGCTQLHAAAATRTDHCSAVQVC